MIKWKIAWKRKEKHIILLHILYIFVQTICVYFSCCCITKWKTNNCIKQTFCYFASLFFFLLISRTICWNRLLIVWHLSVSNAQRERSFNAQVTNKQKWNCIKRFRFEKPPLDACHFNTIKKFPLFSPFEKKIKLKKTSINRSKQAALVGFRVKEEKKNPVLCWL